MDAKPFTFYLQGFTAISEKKSERDGSTTMTFTFIDTDPLGTKISEDYFIRRHRQSPLSHSKSVKFAVSSVQFTGQSNPE
jgi:hypothetical protein